MEGRGGFQSQLEVAVSESRKRLFWGWVMLAIYALTLGVWIIEGRVSWYYSLFKSKDGL